MKPKSMISTLMTGLFALALSSKVFACDFCDGFVEGYKSLAGNNAFVPMCPFEPFTPFGSTPFREGIKAGMAAAKYDIGPPRIRQPGVCKGQ